MYDGETALTRAISGNNMEMTTSLLQNPSININETNRFGRTPIFLAAREDDMSLVEKLITRDADINQSDNCGDTPLHMAALYNHSETIKTLVDAGGDLNARNNRGHTPLYIALDNFSFSTAQTLLHKKCNVNLQCGALQTPLMKLVCHNLRAEIYTEVQNSEVLSMLDSLSQYGALLDEVDDRGNTALHYAVDAKNIYAVICLLHHGANAAIVNASGNTACTFAIELHQYEAAYYMTFYHSMASLVGHFSQMDMTSHILDIKIFHDIFSSCCNDDLDDTCVSLCFKMLDVFDCKTISDLKAKLSSNEQSSKEYQERIHDIFQIQNLQQVCRRTILKSLRGRPLYSVQTLPVATQLKQYLLYGHSLHIQPLTVVNGHVAALEGRDDILNVYKCCSDVLNIKLDGSTAIEKAVRNNHERFVRRLLEDYPHIVLKDDLLHIAARKTNSQMLSILLEFGLDVNSSDQDGNLPIHGAARHGIWHIVRLLFTKTRDVMKKDNNDRHVIHYASASGDYDTVAMVIDQVPQVINIQDGNGFTPLHLASFPWIFLPEEKYTFAIFVFV